MNVPRPGGHPSMRTAELTATVTVCRVAVAVLRAVPALVSHNGVSQWARAC